MKAVKDEWETRAGRKFRWGDFLALLLTLNSEPPVQFAEMHQDEHRLTEEELAEMGLEPNDALTLEVAAMTGTKASLSEETIEAIAERVAQKLIEIQKSQHESHSEEDRHGGN